VRPGNSREQHFWRIFKSSICEHMWRSTWLDSNWQPAQTYIADPARRTSISPGASLRGTLAVMPSSHSPADRSTAVGLLLFPKQSVGITDCSSSSML